jgi:uncharacterized protein YgbK (DUF1537 family)
VNEQIIGVTADDLTGAADSAAALARPDHPIAVSLSGKPRTQSRLRGFAVTTNSRACPADVVYESVRESVDALRSAGAAVIYKKVDSNLRGNIGTELAAVVDAVNGPVLFAPAFPARERTIVQGICLVCGTPVAETEMAQDPEAPVTESDVVALLRGQREDLEVYPCPLSVVCAGPRAIRVSIPHHGVLVIDSETDADLDAVAEIALSLDPVPALAGSAGFASALARRLWGPAVSLRWPGERFGHSLAILASSSEVLATQVETAAKVGFAAIPFPCQDLTREDQPLPELERAIESAASELLASRDAVVHATGPLPHAERPIELVVESLAHLAYVVTRNVSPNGLLVGGGSTAQAVLDALGAEALEIDDEPLPGIAGGLIVGGQLAGHPLALKPGAAGAETAIVQLLDYLGHRQPVEARDR